jgi:hypothetical protein
MRRARSSVAPRRLFPQSPPAGRGEKRLFMLVFESILVRFRLYFSVRKLLFADFFR